MARKVGGIWIKENRLFLKINNQFFNAYKNENKEGKQPDYHIVFGKED